MKILLVTFGSLVLTVLFAEIFSTIVHALIKPKIIGAAVGFLVEKLLHEDSGLISFGLFVWAYLLSTFGFIFYLLFTL